MTLAPDQTNRTHPPRARTADRLTVQRDRSPDRSFGDAVRDAVTRARDHLLSLQEPEGYWKGELETNVTIEAEDLLLRQFLGIRTDEQTERTARWIRRQQRADGTWATFFEGPPDLSTSVEAYVALRLAGDRPDAPHMLRAARYIVGAGGVERSRVFTRLWLALFGLWSWDDLPTMPPEMIFLPSWFPLNVYDWACWARQTVVPLTIVNTVRPARPIGFDIDEIRTGAPPLPPAAPWTVAGAFQRLDKVLHAYGRFARSGPARVVRNLAMRRAAEWIVARQEADGSWGGIQPPWVYSLMALTLLGYSLDHPVVRRGIDGLDGFTIEEQTDDGVVRRMEACQSPVWDTGLAVIALADAGLPADDPRLVRAAQWLLDEEVTVTGDWAVRRPHLLPGGWAFEFANDGYPDTDDTAEVVLALGRVRMPDPRNLDAAVRRGVAWTVGMQCADGGWGAFDADNTRDLILRLPFCDFGAVIDPPSADVTAHIVEMLAALGRADDPATHAGVAWLLRNQEPDGSWFGRWGANHVYGTGAVVPALVAAGIPGGAPAIRRAVRWLEQHQNADGGWGEDMRSYKEPTSWLGRGDSTASQTAWALLALLAAGEESEAVRRGVRWLVDTQRPDGTWDEPQYTGTGFPGDFSINYHLYRLVFPLTALGRYVSGIRVVDLTSSGAAAPKQSHAGAA
jgi:squalene-hopene/tetraprenyl-beta-curcumene cyclase